MATTDYSLMGQFVDLPEHECSGRVCAVTPTRVCLCTNWQTMDAWRANGAQQPGPAVLYYFVTIAGTIFTDKPKYPEKVVAILHENGIVASQSRGGTPKTTTVTPPPAQQPEACKATFTSQGENEMARTALFTKETRQLIEVFASGKLAKEAAKGKEDVVLLSEKDFPATGGYGEFATVTDLFPPVEKKVKEKKEPSAVRTHVKRTGAYELVKEVPTTYNEGDARIEILSALVNNRTVEDFLAAAPAEVTYTSTTGKESKTTAKSYLAYAFKRGWVKVPGEETTEAEAQEPAVEQEPAAA